MRKSVDLLMWAAVVLSASVLVWFYVFVERYGSTRVLSLFGWLDEAWNPDSDYAHGWMFPFVITGLVVLRWKELKAAVEKGTNWAWIPLLLGIGFYLISYRTLQPRIAAGALPFLLWGGAMYLWGWKVAKILTFPLFFFWLAVPLPSFQQATTDLQLLATSMAHHGSSLFGVETYVEGTKVLPVSGDWEPLSIASGCSGIRSLMALLMISAAWAYLAKVAFWKKLVLFFAAVPLAIIGNALRVISIFVIAEYGDAKWASGQWHDWSGLLLFYPISLALLLVVHSVLEGGLPWKRRKVAVKRTVTSSATLSES